MSLSRRSACSAYSACILLEKFLNNNNYNNNYNNNFKKQQALQALQALLLLLLLF